MHKGEVGVIRLNQLLQEALNPGAPGRFRTGDKIMHLKNNYQKAVFNGEIGVVAAGGGAEEPVTVAFESRRIIYQAEELEELTLAYAISVHKSQGSEYPAVILPLMIQHYPMLQRNLLYTGMTRGERLVILIGTARAVEIALENDAPGRRRSRLVDRLQAGPAKRRAKNGNPPETAGGRT
jgi:exodeoxyribonuclease V alpha subunit